MCLGSTGVSCSELIATIIISLIQLPNAFCGDGRALAPTTTQAARAYTFTSRPRRTTHMAVIDAGRPASSVIGMESGSIPAATEASDLVSLAADSTIRSTGTARGSEGAAAPSVGSVVRPAERPAADFGAAVGAALGPLPARIQHTPWDTTVYSATHTASDTVTTTAPAGSGGRGGGEPCGRTRRPARAGPPCADFVGVPGPVVAVTFAHAALGARLMASMCQLRTVGQSLLLLVLVAGSTSACPNLPVRARRR